jgi:hypothetical protein
MLELSRNEKLQVASDLGKAAEHAVNGDFDKMGKELGQAVIALGGGNQVRELVQEELMNAGAAMATDIMTSLL